MWFDKQAEEAAQFYTSVFKNSKIGNVSHYTKDGFEVHGMPEGTAMVVEFELNGQQFQAINGGPHFKFTPAVSFMISCENQEEVDYYWDKLSEGGAPEAQQCGWLADKFGLSWQVVPTAMGDLMSKGTSEQKGNVMVAMLKMKKINIAELEAAHNQQ